MRKRNRKMRNCKDGVRNIMKRRKKRRKAEDVERER